MKNKERTQAIRKIKSIDYLNQVSYTKDNQRKGKGETKMQSQFIVNVSKEYGRRLLPGGARKVSKKQQIISQVINKARRLAKDPLTGKQANDLQRFVSYRLSLHGRYGYKFQMVVDYHKQLVPASDTNAIAMYALDKNFIKY